MGELLRADAQQGSVVCAVLHKQSKLVSSSESGDALLWFSLFSFTFPQLTNIFCVVSFEVLLKSALQNMMSLSSGYIYLLK